MNPPEESVCVMGLGYIGLPTASLLATKGYRVHGVDVRPDTVDTINRGEIHIYEPDLDVMVKSAVQSGFLTASIEPESADIFILAVPTPFKGKHEPDLSYVESATRSLAPHLRPGNLVILESTSPIGTTEHVARWIQEQRPDLGLPRWKGDANSDPRTSIFIAHCPERVLPGHILRELVENDRVVGGIDHASTVKAAAFYATFVAGKILETDSRTAEMCKLTENASRDVSIAFANELSLVCDQHDIDVWELIELANHHPRVNILRPGPGVGGHCIAVDPWFIIHSAPERTPLMRTAREVNTHKPHWVVDRVCEAAKAFASPTIACLGLAFKADIDDLRESPAVEIVERLHEKQAGNLLLVEPHIDHLPERLDRHGLRLSNLDDALRNADVIVLLVDHQDFCNQTPSMLADKTIIDMRGVWR